ncbi:MAG: polysaccharide deacetylase family protein [Deltaproteobacteria bacterium]|nr:polysaccharide deacetylase family protein [Deltaproteobacteria bacterium]
MSTAYLHEPSPLPAAPGNDFIVRPRSPGALRFQKKSGDAANGLTNEELAANPIIEAVAVPGPGAWPLPRPGAEHSAPRDITRGTADRMEVAITFDGGYEDGDADAILSTLRSRGIKTTVFLTGTFIKKYPEVARRIVRDGHEVGNHTMTHPHLTDFERTYRQTTKQGVDRAMLASELRQTAALFKETTGAEMAPLWRAPYGEENDEIRRWAFEEGYAHIGWTYDGKRKESLDTLDWVGDASSRLYRTAYEIRDRVLNFGRNANGVRGGIVLMHLGTERKRDKASEVLGEIIDGLAASGYRMVPVSKLLEGDKTLGSVRLLRSGRVMKGMVRLDSQDGPAPAPATRFTATPLFNAGESAPAPATRFTAAPLFNAGEDAQTRPPIPGRPAFNAGEDAPAPATRFTATPLFNAGEDAPAPATRFTAAPLAPSTPPAR